MLPHALEMEGERRNIPVGMTRAMLLTSCPTEAYDESDAVAVGGIVADSVVRRSPATCDDSVLNLFFKRLVFLY